MYIKVKGLIEPKGDYFKFDSVDDKISFLKNIKLLSKTAEEEKAMFYKGIFSEEPCVCDVVGYETKSTLIISLDDHLHCINIDCFKEMQKNYDENSKYIDNKPVFCEV